MITSRLDRHRDRLRLRARSKEGWSGCARSVLTTRHIISAGAYGLHRLKLDAWSGNERALRAFTHAGFREEGRRRAAALVQGKRYDVVLFGLLREEWADGL